MGNGEDASAFDVCEPYWKAFGKVLLSKKGKPINKLELYIFRYILVKRKIYEINIKMK